MKQFQCHKRVNATKIIKVESIVATGEFVHTYENGTTATYKAGDQKIARYFPVEGDYLVRYADGYEAFSPAKAFEAGYTEASDWSRMDSIARVCHEVNRAYCEALGDNSQAAWEDAPAWQRESARMGVDLHMMGDFGPEASHISWAAEKLANGWKYGPAKDPEKKEHPCMVDFAELPREQQAKDFIFRAVVHALRGSEMVNASLAAGSFGQALQHLEKGRKVARAGWNGKGMYVYQVPANSYPPSTEAAKKEFGGDLVPYNAYFAIKNVNNTISTWVPSVNDCLADDWTVVP